MTPNLSTRRSRGRIVCPLLLAAMALAGCQTRGNVRPVSSDIDPPPVFVQTPERCLATEARFALGRRISAPLLEELRQRTGARQAGTVLPGEAPPATADASHLVVDIEPDGRIVGARCG